MLTAFLFSLSLSLSLAPSSQKTTSRTPSLVLIKFLQSLILLVLEAGIDIDLSTLKLIGTRGFMIAFFGSILPIGIGMFIAYILGVDGGDTKAIIASGATFGPTSLGIALNILRSGGILNT